MQMNRRKKPRERKATDAEILQWMMDNGIVEKLGDKYHVTFPKGLHFVASKPPGTVTKYIPGASPQT